MEPGMRHGWTGHCNRCEEPAVIRMDDNLRFCSDHLVEYVDDRVFAHICGNRMVSPGDHLAVAFSGGKDSSALLIILNHIRSKIPAVSMTAVTIDEGISGYREETIHAASELARELGVRHILVPFHELFGKDLDRFVRGREERSCTLCGILRRRALNVAAHRIGATRIATGHNLDDEAQSILMNMLRGDLRRLVQDSASGEPDRFIPRIKPLSVITEKEVLAYLVTQGRFIELPECPYADSALRSEIRRIVYRLEDQHPGARNRVIRSRDIIRTRSAGTIRQDELRTCRECGEISSDDLCQVCRVLQEGRDT